MAIPTNTAASNPRRETTTTFDIDDLTKSAAKTDDYSAEEAEMSEEASLDQDQAQGDAQQASFQAGEGDTAIDLVKSSVMNVLDSVVREYEPQIQQFTANIAHQAVDRGVELAQQAVGRVQKQSWLKLGLAAALGIGAIAILSYEASEVASNDKAASRARRRPTH